MCYIWNGWTLTRLVFWYQQFLTCQTYTDKGGLRQQQMVAFIPRHHKHYILPSSTNFFNFFWSVTLCRAMLSISHSITLCFPLFVLDSFNKKVHFSPQIQTDARQNHFQARSCLHLSGIKCSERDIYSWWILYCFFVYFSQCWWEGSNYLLKHCIRFPSIKNSFLAHSFRDQVYIERDSACYDKVTM